MDKTAGRPKRRWRDNLICPIGPAWPRIARACGDSSGRGSSLFSERNLDGKNSVKRMKEHDQDDENNVFSRMDKFIHSQEIYLVDTSEKIETRVWL